MTRRVAAHGAVALAVILTLSACQAPVAKQFLLPTPPTEIRKVDAKVPPAPVPPPVAAPAPPDNASKAADNVAATDNATLPAPPPPPLKPDWAGLYREAIAKTLLALSPGGDRNPALSAWRGLEDSPYGSDAVFNQAVLLHLAGSLSEAESLYRRQAENTPPHAPSAANLLGILILRGDHEGLGKLSASVAPAGTDLSALPPELVVNLAATRFELGDTTGAESALAALPAESRGTASASWLLALLDYRRGDAAKAKARAAALPPSTIALFPVAASRMAWEDNTYSIPSIGDSTLPASRMEALRNIVMAWQESSAGRTQTADNTLRKLSGGTEFDGEALSNLGLLALKAGRWGDAKKAFETAARKPNPPAEAWLNLGIYREVYEGNAAGAVECYANYVRLGGSKKSEVQAWLDRLQTSQPAPSPSP